MLPTDAKQRKDMPIARGFLDYFPDAIAAVAEVSRLGNEQHNPGQPLHWAKEKSTDHADCIARHLLDRGKLDTDGARHSAKLAWRALALLQIEIEEWANSTLKQQPGVVSGTITDTPQPVLKRGGFTITRDPQQRVQSERDVKQAWSRGVTVVPAPARGLWEIPQDMWECPDCGELCPPDLNRIPCGKVVPK